MAHSRSYQITSSVAVDDYDSLIRAVVAGDRAAWSQLVGALVPQIRRLAASHESKRGRVSASTRDDVSEVATGSLERLSRDRFHNLRRYLGQRDRLGVRAQSFDSWLYGAVDFTLREHARRRNGRGGRRSGAGRRSEAPPASLSESGVNGRLALPQILEYADAHFAQSEARALRLHHAEGVAFTEIAERLGLPDAPAAEHLIRKLNQRLRQRFGSKHLR